MGYGVCWLWCAVRKHVFIFLAARDKPYTILEYILYFDIPTDAHLEMPTGSVMPF